MAHVPPELQKVKEDVEEDQPPIISVRQLLQWFGSHRRGRHVVSSIRSALRQVELTTEPDFDSVWIDGSVTFRARNRPTPIRPEREDAAADQPVAIDPTAGGEGPPAQAMDERPSTRAVDPPAAPAVPVRTLEPQDHSHSVRKLDAANREVTSVTPNTLINEAVTVMMLKDYSQLPVMQGERSVKGMFSWESLGSRRMLAGECQTVGEAMGPPPKMVSVEASIFQVADLLKTEGAVLVHASATDLRIVGIVTTADMTAQFAVLGEPFLLIGEIENRVRALIDGCFSPEELVAAKNPWDADRVVEGAADLTFGEYVRLLQNAPSWKKCGLPFDHRTFIKHLEEVRDVRNDVMHFEPDGIGPDAIGSLRRFATSLSRVSTARE